jgi:hypothetical protein
MTSDIFLSPAEFRSLEELGKGVLHGAIPPSHGTTLKGHGFAYTLLGQVRITTLGRARLKIGA